MKIQRLDQINLMLFGTKKEKIQLIDRIKIVCDGNKYQIDVDNFFFRYYIAFLDTSSMKKV